MDKTYLEQVVLTNALANLSEEDKVYLAGCSLDTHPTKHNWVEDAGGLPEYICEIARAIMRSGGHTTGEAISIAVSRCKVWASGGGNVDADTRAKAAKAVAEWEKKKASSHVKASAVEPVDDPIERLKLMLSAKHDLIFYENRNTPEVVPHGSEGKKKGGKAGKVVKRRPATAEEEKQIASGKWVRVDKSGNKPNDSKYHGGSKIRPQLKNKKSKS